MNDIDNEIYVIREGKDFIGIDQSSGVYPWNTNYSHAEKFTRASAHEYRDVMNKPEWTLWLVTESDNGISWIEVPWDVPISKRFWEK